MNRKPLFLTLFCIATFVDAADYRYSRELQLADGGEQSLVAVPLDAAVYKSTAGDFRDLVLLDQQNQETAYLLQKIASRKTESRRITLASGESSLQTRPDGGLSVTVKLETVGAYADGLTLNTGQRDFEYSIKVEGSIDGDVWYPLVDQAEIYDYSRYMAIANRDVALPANIYHFLRIGIDRAVQSHVGELTELTRTLRGNEELQRDEKTQVVQQALHLDGIALWRMQTDHVADAEQAFRYAPSAFKISRDRERQVTLVDVTMDHQPLNGFDLDVATPNFSRHAEVQIPIQQGLETRMQILGAGTLEALRFRDVNRLQNHLGFPEQRRGDYRIVINDLDNPPLDISKVIGSGPGYQLAFIHQPGKQYRLLYGAEVDAKPRYDIEAIQELQRQGYPAETASLGPEVATPTTEKPLDFAALINSKAFLTSVIVLMVLALGWSLFKIGKRVSNLDRPARPK